MKRFTVSISIGCLAVATAVAGPRTSASYAVPTEATDGGGRRATSASYTADASVGEAGGISTAATPTVTAKAGYAGQLYDVTGTTITAASTAVNERATLPLAAWQLLDDASLLAVSPTAVTWGVASGPISGISPGGIATAATVYQNSAATVQGTFGGFTGTLGLTVVNVDTDDLGTYASDGLDDAWQVQFFGLNNPLAAPGVDASGTGQTNLFKFIAGLNPVDPASRFIVDTQAVPGAPLSRKVIFSPYLTDRTYVVEGTPDLTSWTTVTGTVQDSGNTRTVTDAAAGLRKFYRVKITKP